MRPEHFSGRCVARSGAALTGWTGSSSELFGRPAFGTHDASERWIVGMALCVIAAIVAVVGFGLDRITLDVLTGALTVLVLFVVSVPLLQRIARVEGDPGMTRILLWGLFAKFVFTLVRYFVINVVYAGNADAGVYSDGGAYLAPLYRAGHFTTDIPVLSGRGEETARIAVVVGVVYAITGVSKYAASFVFAWICFVGQVLMWRAFKRAVPEGDHRRYALLVLFLPSMLFWPSSIGKEAVMVASIGLVSYGAALILGDRVSVAGVATFLAGAGCLAFIRPHMAVIALVALGFASLVGTLAGFRRSASPRIFIVRVLALIVLVIAASAAVSQTSRVLGSGSDSASTSEESGISGVFAKTEEQTKQGGSEYAPVAVNSPAELPAGVVTVLFRPFPWEAHNMNGLIASAEGLLLIGLFVVGHRRLITWARTLLKRPYLVYAAAYELTFIVTFSYIANFGILARQRTQMLPLVLTMIAMYPAARTRSSWLGSRPTATEPVAEISADVDGEPEPAAVGDGVPTARHAL